MSTRASQAVTSRQAKHDLVRLLFGPSLLGKGPEAHRKLDPTIYSFAELRKAYLDRVHEIHPDKHNHHSSQEPTETWHTNENNNDDGNNNSSNDNSNNYKNNKQAQRDSMHAEFVKLQDAWDKYEQVAKIMMQTVGSSGSTSRTTTTTRTASNFTMFGVGCSFSDTPEERRKRDEIMDQAGRGWFSAGAIPESSTTTATISTKPSPVTPVVSLCDDDMFVEYNNNNNSSDSEEPQETTISNDNNDAESLKPKPSLIPEGYRRRR